MLGKRTGRGRVAAGVAAATAALLAGGALSARADAIGPRTGCALGTPRL